MNRVAVFIGLSFLLFVGAVSCKKDQRDPCLQPRTTVLTARCVRYLDTGIALADTALPNPVLHPITDQPNQYYYGGKRLINLSFSLSNLSDFSRWVLRPDSAVAIQDTLSFYYQRQLHFLSNACGYTYFYHIDSVTYTRNAIYSVLLMAADITTDAKIENLKIIFKKP